MYLHANKELNSINTVVELTGILMEFCFKMTHEITDTKHNVSISNNTNTQT